MGIIMDLNVAIVVLNTLLLSALLWVYGGMLREMRTRFTWGLLGFAAVLWLQNVTQLYCFATMMSYFVDGLAPLVLVQNVLATVASVLLLSVTLVPAGRPRVAEA